MKTADSIMQWVFVAAGAGWVVLLWVFVVGLAAYLWKEFRK